jgi:hypothetical protein
MPKYNFQKKRTSSPRGHLTGVIELVSCLTLGAELALFDLGSCLTLGEIL